MYTFSLSILLFGVLISVSGNNSDLAKIDSVHMERPCQRSGGFCVFEEDCPSGALADKGLCPLQRANGVECCYGISIKETRCSKVGGWCTPPDYFCARSQIFAPASDCPDTYNCCILTL